MALLPVFVDTSYVYALINPNDQWHARAIEWRSRLSESDTRLLTTQFVLAEIADGLSAQKFRGAAASVIRRLSDNPQIEVIPVSPSLFSAGLDLYESRPDKDWGFTDCTSFVTMMMHSVSDALSTDEHFRQAGFRPLLLS